MSEDNTVRRYHAVRDSATGTVDYVAEYTGPNNSSTSNQQAPSRYRAVRDSATGTVDHVPEYDAPYKPMTGDEKVGLFRIFVFLLQWCVTLPIGIVSIIIGCIKKAEGSTVGATLWIIYGIFGLICTIVTWCLAIIPAL